METNKNSLSNILLLVIACSGRFCEHRRDSG